MREELFHIIFGILIPFLGTTIGAGSVFFVKNEIKPVIQKLLLGFASGIMVAASVWSLLIPAMEMCESAGKLAFVPAAAGFSIGMVFLWGLDKLIPHLHMGSDTPEGPKSNLKKTTMLVFAVTLHNLPEGMAVGVVFAGLLTGSAPITAAGAFALTIGIAIQNFPEGAIISLPLHSEGQSKLRAFVMGTLSGVVEPIGALVTILCAKFLVPIVPYMLAFAAGAMIYVVVEELIPESAQGEHSDMGTMGFAVGFLIMMILDVALG